ncbi:MAG: flagellar hook protein FlgE [Rhizobiales bacterium]|nr:flagellar hook protein FlgE [Hyphomicrobiales bacterium]
MSLYGVMRTSTSGMNAQASRISVVAENVANSNTTGYKASRMEFSSLFIENNISSYNSGSVDGNVRNLNSVQGTLAPTNSTTDLALKGEGFFVVQSPSGQNVLTRAGNFVSNGDGDLINAAGFTLLGYPLVPTPATIVVNGFNGLVPVNLGELSLSATPSTSGVFQANLPSEAVAVAAADLPSANAATATFSAKSSIVAYGNLGEQMLLDVYFSKTGPSTWEVAAFDRNNAGPTGGFPYSAGPLSTTTLSFDPSNGQLAGASPTNITIPVPSGANLTLDFSAMSQLAGPYTVQAAQVNGNGASYVDLVEISNDGTVYIAYEDGRREAVFRIPLANVESPDNLDSLTGNVFTATSESGPIQVGFAGEGGLGEIKSGALEQSTVDLASEFTDMIDAQRSYTANSKVFQTGAELMDVLVNLKR